MSIISKTLPQNLEPIKTTTLKDLVDVLPNKIDYPINVWIGGKIVTYAIATGMVSNALSSGDAPAATMTGVASMTGISTIQF